MIEHVDERTVRAYFDALDPLVRPETVLYLFGGAEVRASVDRLQPVFRNDALVREKLANLETDLQMWEGSR